MLLGELLKSTKKKYKNIPVRGISFDSRKVKKNYIFFAIKGNKLSGHKFINEAISNGASAVVCNKKIKIKKNEVPLLVVHDTRKTLSEASAKFYKQKINNIIAVTGTNGKSSVASFFYQILNLNKIKVASIGTLGVFAKNYKKKLNLTSVDPPLLHKNLKILYKKKIKNVILEASSHGLNQKRLDNLKIKVGIFTNLSHDHLDYHKSMKSYFNSKMHLFKNLLPKNSTIITDTDNKEFKILKNIANQRNLKKLTIGSKLGNLRILHHKYKQDKQIIKISINFKIFILEIPLIGFFQTKNLLMAFLAALSCGLNQNKIIKIIPKIKPVPGRLERVANIKNNSKIIVDFAHTPNALEQSLVALRDQFGKNIILVFGCGGDRDKKKRLKMGKIAKKYCKKVFVTDDNPRNENPKKIRKTIIKGCRKIAKEVGNRKKAIEAAIREIKSDEILLVAGKGHENTQDYGNKVINFSDKMVIKEIVKRKKFSKKKFSYQDSLLKEIFYPKKIKNANYNGVSINSKTVKKNDLFFAIKGQKNDGHKFAREALQKGAVKLVISKKTKQLPRNKTIKVKNTFLSLNNLAKVTRNKTLAHIIGITGSVGKTTLKNLLGFALKNYGKVYHSPRSYNNKYGVPLSLSNLKKDTKYGIFEIGMNKKGEIEQLSKIVKPEIAIITNISGAHFKNFDTLTDIANAKSEIINNITKGGFIILNKDDNFFNYLSNKSKKKGVHVVSFSSKKKADIFLLKKTKIKNYYRLKIRIKNKNFYFDIKHFANNFIENVLACISILFLLNLNLNKMKKKFTNFEIPEGRGDVTAIKKFRKKFTLIDESYNANPLSMSSAIENMNYYKRKNNSQKLIFLGDMLELGHKSKKFHRDLSQVINRSDVDKVFVYGKYIRETFNFLSKNKKGKVFNNLGEAYNHFHKILHNNDLLMIKGSNATGLNRFSKNIKKGQISVI